MRLAAQAVRVLHAVVTFKVRLANLAACGKRAVGGCAVDLPWLAAHDVYARVKRAVAAACGIECDGA